MMAAPAQVPPVTMDDLQAFQARHFLGSSNSSASYDVEDTSCGDDGLGYYADGVKRTLTDQQIEIFRHSEIQSLLRERRLKEQARLEKMDTDSLDIANNPDVAVVKVGSTTIQENRKVDGTGKQPRSSDLSKGEAGYVDGERVTANEKERKLDVYTESSSAIALDYDEDTLSSDKSAAPTAQAQLSFLGRKMVSYGDDA